MAKRLAALLTVLVLVVAGLQAQLSLPHTTFTPGQTISSSQFTTNFTQISNNALNRTGGTMTGALLFSADNTHDVGASGATRPRDVFVGRNMEVGGTLGITGASTFAAISATTGTFSSTLGVTGAATLSSTLAVTGAVTLTSTLAVNSTSAAAIDVAGGITAGSGNVAIVDTTGKIPAISSIYFASLSGANLTGLLEANIADGTVFPRLAANETISGVYTHSAALRLANTVALAGRNNVAADVSLAVVDASNNVIFGQHDGGVSALTTLAGGSSVGVNTNLTQRTTWSSTGTLTHGYALALTGVSSPAALASGNNNNYNPAGLSEAYLVRLTGAGGGSTLTGLAGGSAGRKLVLCALTTDGITIAEEDANSTAANRFTETSPLTLTTGLGGHPCQEFIYDGTSSRWRPVGATS